MVLNKLKSSIIIVVFLFSIGCESNKLDSQCGGVSVRLMYSTVESSFEDVTKSINTSNQNARNLIESVANLRKFNIDLIELAGGYKSGKSLEMGHPCKNGEQVSAIFKNFKAEQKYNDLVNLLFTNGLIDEGKASNMRFIISSYFCKETCTFSDYNLASSPIGMLILENLTLQFNLLEIIQL